jgi:hypothetical protein
MACLVRQNGGKPPHFINTRLDTTNLCYCEAAREALLWQFT